MREKITHYIRAGYAGLYLVSHEEQRVEAELKAIAAALKHRLYAWSATAGLIDTADGTSRGAQDPMEVLGVLAELPEDSIVLLRDYHLFFDDPNPLLLRQLKDQLRAGKTKGHTVAVLGCRLKLPPELEREFIVVDFTLPGAEALGEVLSGILKSTGKKRPSPESTAALIDAARGLTTTEAEDAFALSVVECGDLNPAVVAREKAQAVKKNGLLELIETTRVPRFHRRPRPAQGLAAQTPRGVHPAGEGIRPAHAEGRAHARHPRLRQIAHREGHGQRVRRAAPAPGCRAHLRRPGRAIGVQPPRRDPDRRGHRPVRALDR